MGTNTKNLQIIKRVYGGDAGKQIAELREIVEILLIERDGMSFDGADEQISNWRLKNQKVPELLEQLELEKIQRKAYEESEKIKIEKIKQDEIEKKKLEQEKNKDIEDDIIGEI